MEEPMSRATSPFGDSNISGGRDLTTRIVTPTSERLIMGDITSKNSTRTPPTKKAKRIRFFRNGDKFYTGIVMAVTPERYRSFDSLASDLTRALISSVTLPNGVRAIYSMDGKKIQSVSDLEDGKCYVVSGQGELFKKVEYSAAKVRRGSSLSGLPQSPAGTGKQVNAIPVCVKARIITLIRHGSKPRKVLRLLLNKRNSASLEHVLEAITEVVKLDCGAVRRVYTLSGKLVISLEQFFENEEVFLAYGSERSVQEDFELDVEESKSVQSFRRGPWISKRQSGPMPVMPHKTGKRTLTAPQVRTPSPSTLILPQPLRMHYTVGHVIGDGNFAVVRHCVQKQSGAEYAAKIVDKNKCQGKETMLMSEVAILRQVCHPNIISLIDEQETADQLFLIMELVKGGDLFDAIAAVTKFSEPEASVMIGHLTSALAYLHSHSIVHRDVKPENLLVEMEGSRVRCLKLGDFGLAQVVKEPLYTVCGTPTYVAPEILEEIGYGLKIDVWAAGAILYILLCGFPPFVSPDNDQEELFELILSGQYEFTSPYWDPISDSAKELISNMLQTQPELRFSAEDVLDHPWLVSFLGGDQATTGAVAISKSPQQHRNQQCQPLRVATFEFDYKKQRCSNDSSTQDNDISGIIVTSPVSRNQWFDDSFNKCSGENARVHSQDQIDHFNGNGIDDDPVSLSAECLHDIRALTTSMQDLMNNIEGNTSEQTKMKEGVTSSLNSIVENMYSSTKNNNGHCQSPLSSKVHSTNKRNDNSISDIHSNATTLSHHDNVKHFYTSKSDKYSNCYKPRSKRTSIHNVNAVSATTNSKGSNKNLLNDTLSKKLHTDYLSHSMDGLSGSSDNNIETSDSFVNIKFARIAKDNPDSSSTQSTASSESFENICFHDRTKNVNAVQKNQPHNVNLRQNTKKTSTNITGNRHSMVSKLPRASQIPIQINDQQNSSRLSHKLDSIKLSPSESVKLREKKIPVNSSSQIKREKNKRYSYFAQDSAKRVQESSESNKVNNKIVNNGRKFSSTDELRDEQQKPSTKSNRFSLYYTPQLSRKTYESDGEARKCIKNMNNSHEGSRPTSEKFSEAEKATGDIAEVRRNQRSVGENVTVTKRNKTSKQSINTRSNVKSMPEGKIT